MERFVRSDGNYDMDAASFESGVECKDESLTVQSQRDDADINVIVDRFGLTGQLPQGLVPPTFADFDEIFDFQSAQNALIAAEQAFMRLPAKVRSRFGNSPQEFVVFASDPGNLQEMREMGLADPAKPVPSPVAPPVAPVVPSSSAVPVGPRVT